MANPELIDEAQVYAPAQDVIDRLPYGLVVARADGALQVANTAALRLLSSTHRPYLIERDLEHGAIASAFRRCEQLFDCRAPGGPCEHGCLVARAAHAHEPLPEIRIDTLPGVDASAVWVTASPLSAPGTALLHLRPGVARDRRRRTDPHWLNGPSLRITALGPLRVQSDQGPLDGAWLSHRSGAVLKFLVCHRDRVVRAEELAEALWPESGRHGLNNARQFVHALRQQLEPDRRGGEISSFITTVGGGYGLDRRHVEIDIDAFEIAARVGLAAAAAGDPEVAVERLDLAVSVYRGDLFSDEPYAEWVFPERDRLRATAAEALRELAGLAIARQDLPSASFALDRLASIEPLDVDVHRDLLAVCLAQGRRTEASRRYATFKTRMARELGEGPGFALADARLRRPES